MADKNVDLSIGVSVNDRASGQIKQLESRIIRFVGAISAALASVKLIAFPITESSTFERKMKDVQKTTGFLNTQIKQLSKSIKQMSSDLSVRADDLADIAAVAGQLGLGDAGIQSIEKFTASVARAKVTLSLAAEEAANAGATIANIFSIDVGNVERIFSAVNELSNTSVAAGIDLIDIVKRVGNTADLEVDKVIALAAYIKELGVPNEQAGTFLVKAFSNMLAEGKKFAAAMGITQNEWIVRVKRDAVGAFQDITKRLYEMEDGVRELSTKELFGSGRLFSAANKAVSDVANGQAKLTKFLESSNKAFTEGTSSIDEYKTIVEATSEQYTILLNKLNVIAINIGEKLLPIIKDSILELQKFFDGDKAQLFFDKLGNSIANLIVDIRDFVTYLSNMDIAWSNVLQAIKLFLGYEIAKTLLGISASIASSIVKVNAYTAAWGRASAAQRAAASASVAPGTAGSISSLVPVVGAFTSKIKKSQEAFAAVREEARILHKEEIAAIATERNKTTLVKQRADWKVREQQESIKNIRLEREHYMEQTRLERKLAIKKAAGNKKALREIEAGWAKRKQWARDNYNFIRREETKLAALRKVAVTAGIGVGPAAVLAAKKQQAALKAMNASYLAHGKSIGLINGLLGSAVALAGRLGGLLLNVGKTLLTFAGGWVGLALTGVFIFWDEIKGLLGFITKEEEDARARALIAKKELEAARQSAKEAMDAAKTAMEGYRSLNGGKVSIDAMIDFGQLVDTGTQAEINKSVDAVLDKISKLVEAYNKSKEAVSSYGKVATSALQDVLRSENKLNDIKKQIENYEAEAAATVNLGGPNSGIDATSSKLKELYKEYRKQEQVLQSYKAKLEEVDETLKGQVDVLSEIEENMQNVSFPELGQVFDEATLAYVTASGNIVKFNEQVQEAGDAIREAQVKIDSFQAEGASNLDIAELVGIKKDSTRKLNEATSRVTELKEVMRILRSNFSTNQVKIANTVDKLTDSTKKAMSEMSSTLSYYVSVNDDIESSTEKAAAKLLAQAAVWEAVKKEIDAAAIAIKGFVSNAKGIKDNTASEVRSLISSITDFRVSLRKQFSDTKFRISLEVDDKENKIQKRLDEDIEWVENYYNDRIAKATNRISKERLERWKEEAIEIRKNIASKKLAILEETKLSAAIERSKTQYEKYLDAAKDAAAKAAKSGSQEDAQAALFNKELAEGELKNYMEKVKSLVGLTYKSISGKEIQLLDEGDLKKFESEYAKMASGLAATVPGVNEGAYDGFMLAQKAITTQQETANTNLSTMVDKLGTLSGKYKDFATFMKSATNSLDKYFPQLNSIVENVKETMSGVSTGNFDASTFNTESVTNNVGTQIAESLKDAVSNTKFSDALKQAMQEGIDSVDTAKLKEKLRGAFESNGTEVPDGLGAIKPVTALVDIDLNQESVGPLQKKVGELKLEGTLDLTNVTLPTNYTLTPTGETGTYDVKEPVKKYASGGLVTGPGTGTSDSIMAWVSNKEYIIDAFTTKFFGSGFFSALQSIAKKGKRSVSLKDGMPAFASGGYVGSALSTYANSKEKIAEFDLNGRKYQFSATEDTINSFGRAIKVLSTKRSRVR